MPHGLIDTHCHLEMDAFDRDRDEVIRRARDAGIEAIITIGSDMAGNTGGIELSKQYECIYATVGFHPHDAKDFTADIFHQIKQWATSSPDFPSAREGSGIGEYAAEIQRRHKVVAIGEIGLDYHYDNSPRHIQREVFVQQLQLAKDLSLPVVIHSREAKRDTLDIVKESGVTSGVFHCFSGDREMAEKVISMGFHISIAGPVTFRKAGKLKEIAANIPDDHLLIETDAPYLTPEPFRGRRNEPAYIVHTAHAIAVLREVSAEDIARITTLNAKRLFRIGSVPAEGEVAYQIRNSLYLNITNRCTNTCSFCIRFQSDYVKGHNLRLDHEPTLEELKSAVGDPTRYHEVVFCGYGEPLLRLDVVRNLAEWIKQKNGRVRINTNGHGNLIYGRNILPELQGLVDSISVSLDAHDEATYNKICRPSFRDAFNAVISFIREAKRHVPQVQATVVSVPDVDIGKCRKIAAELGVELRVRKLDIVG